MLAAITYPAELPVSRQREEIARAIRENQVVIVAGATGSGKTTQLPKICLELGRESIGHTQPRRLAARTIAERIAEELGEEVGGVVGYQVRFTDKASASTRIKLMTDGILLNEMHHDRMLRRYDTIIIDEAHERSLNIDFLLGYLKQLLPKRPDLKVIVTSATIDPESFARHFADASGEPAPIIEVSGRTYPVEIRYRPLVAEDSATDDPDDDPVPTGSVSTGSVSTGSTRRGSADSPRKADDKDYLQGIIEALDELDRESRGDVLVFLSGENEIRDAEEAVRGHYSGRGASVTEVLPLYGRLSAADQHRVFQPSTVAGVRRRVVLATNVAETSLTVPGIKYVIDAGTARISRYSVRSKVQRLPIEAISQASANQRSGRSGRTSDGIAIRLYSEEDFARRPEFTEPEVLRTNLAAVILQMISLGLGDIEAFPFLTPPDARGVKDGVELLRELGAVEAGSGAAAGNRLTKVGRALAKLPIEPRFGRMVVESKQHGVSREVLAIVAGLTIQDPRERPLERRQQADEQHARFADPTSDFITLLNLWNHLETQQRELGSSAFRRMCKNEFLNYLRVREWNDVYRQLRQMARPLGLEIDDKTPGGGTAPDADLIHKSLLAGLLSHIGLKDSPASTTQSGARGGAASGGRKPKGEYLGARQSRFLIFPGSALAKKQPDAIMSAELVETSRLFARMNAAIDPAWAEPLAGSLLKRSYSEPHWEKRQGSAVAYEKVTLYGVPIIARRRIQLSRVDQAYARELFIRHALVEGDWPNDIRRDRLFDFDRKNRKLRAELEAVEERSRRRDILFDDEAVYEFYDSRIPADVTSTRLFETWWRTAKQESPELLTMTAESLAPDDAPAIDEDAFPPNWRQDDQTLALRYRFEPGASDDGVTVQVPLVLLARLRPEGFDRQVPGLRTELVTAMIKALPKVIRRNVVPANDWAAKIVAELGEADAPAGMSFADEVAAVIKRLTHTPVTGADFAMDRIPPHLQMSFRVVDGRGKQLAVGKDLRALQAQLADRARDAVADTFAAPARGERGPRGPRQVDGPVTPGSIAAAGEAPGAGIERTGLTSWDFAELPRFVDTTVGGNRVRAYPALIDDGAAVNIRLLATPEEQARAMPGGIRRLLMLATPSPVNYVQQHLTGNEKLVLATSPYPSTTALFADCLVACVNDVLYRVKDDGMLFTKLEFDTVRDRVSGVVMDTMFETVGLVARTLTALRTAEKTVNSATSMALLPALSDAKEQLAGLVFPGFVSRTGLERLRHVPRYLEGVTMRVGKLVDNPGRDRVWMNEVQTALTRFADAGGTIPLAPDAPANVVRARWLIEELRISLFAQELRAAESVSLQRITKLLQG
ncbi:ATP-dependent helicase HrpA [Agromyces cerinus]|uniref:ATP-dependent RNA helicase HrpA n=1 Tax=Agromyces cerinus TaxID=33878 RepID=UPI0035AC008E|nr:ATP-dependent helicase HrpA [Agromyces cerinus]